ncbi:MAG: RNA chaperone Hfq [Acetobacter sp.]|nr:RNA chaperone Hfq [Acetobacter sp.]
MENHKTSIQNAFLIQVCRSHSVVTIFLVNGVKLQGFITYFDDQVILLRRDDQTQLIYKHAISTVMPSVSISLSDMALSTVVSDKK